MIGAVSSSSSVNVLLRLYRSAETSYQSFGVAGQSQSECVVELFVNGFVRDGCVMISPGGWLVARDEMTNGEPHGHLVVHRVVWTQGELCRMGETASMLLRMRARGSWRIVVASVAVESCARRDGCVTLCWWRPRVVGCAPSDDGGRRCTGDEVGDVEE